MSPVANFPAWLPGGSWPQLFAGIVVLLALVTWCWRCATRPGHAVRDGGVAAVLFVALLAVGRVPELRQYASVASDEAELVVGARAVRLDPLAFRNVDVAPSGPLTVALLAVLPGVPGVPSARAAALVLDAGALLFAFLGLRSLYGSGQARLLIVPVATVIAVGRGVAAFSAWHLIAFLGGVAFWGMQENGGPRSRRWARWSYTGLAALALGLLPWVHRGGAFWAVLLWLAHLVVAPRVADGERRHRLAIGGLAAYVAAVVICLAHGIGIWPAFWTEYAAWSGAGRIGLGTATGLWWCVLVVMVAACVTGLVAGRESDARRARRTLGAGALALTILGAAWSRQVAAPSLSSAHEDAALAAIVTAIGTYRQPPDRLAVWGTVPQLYLAANLPAATNRFMIAPAMLPPSGGVIRARFLADVQATHPTFFVDGLGLGAPAGPDPGARTGAFPELRDYLREYYRLLLVNEYGRLYLRHERVAESVREKVQGTMLDLAEIRVLQSVGSISEIENRRWFAHAPSVFRYTTREDNHVLRGTFGFLPSAYADAKSATDGATFIIDGLRIDGRRERLLERRLAPTTNPDDRGPMPFLLDLPSGALRELEFRIEAGAGMNCDWTYWGELQFETLGATPEAVP